MQTIISPTGYFSIVLLNYNTSLNNFSMRQLLIIPFKETHMTKNTNTHELLQSFCQKTSIHPAWLHKLKTWTWTTPPTFIFPRSNGVYQPWLYNSIPSIALWVMLWTKYTWPVHPQGWTKGTDPQMAPHLLWDQYRAQINSDRSLYSSMSGLRLGRRTPRQLIYRWVLP